MTLTVTDLPAPLSPTSAVTCPPGTVRFTPCSAVTGPIPLRTSMGRISGSAPTLPPVLAACELTWSLLPYPCRGALLLEAGAQLADVDEAVGHDRVGHVLGRDPDGREEHGGHVGAALGVGGGAVHEAGGRLHAGAQEGRGRGGRLRPEPAPPGGGAA